MTEQGRLRIYACWKIRWEFYYLVADYARFRRFLQLGRIVLRLRLVLGDGLFR